MDVIQIIYQLVWLQPVYNLMVWVYAQLGQQQSGLTMIIIGLIAAVFCVPLMIRGFHDQRKTKLLADQIDLIKSETKDEQQQQQQILQLLKKKQIRFQSESVFLVILALVQVAIYPVLLSHWVIDPNLLYDFILAPDSIIPEFGPLNVTRSSPTLSLLPALFLYVELRQSYREQRFLTNPIDRWYPVILPLFVYFLIFWLPSGIALVMSAMLAVSLYVRFLLEMFSKRQDRVSA